MSERFIDLKQSNLYLFNLLFRHQVYLEGVKAGMASIYKRMLNHLYGEFAKFMGQSRYESLDGFTRNEMMNFIRRFQWAQTKVYNQYTQQLIDLLKQFVAADVEVTGAIYKAVTGKTTAEHQPQPKDKPSILGVAPTLETPDANASLWASISSTIIPANGMTIPEMLSSFGETTTLKVNRQLLIGYANGESTREVMSSIVGEHESNFRDGLFATFNNQNNSILATALQHASCITGAAIASVHYSKYQWIAILDSRTTLICRSRNGNVYTYGEGPLPPAHYNCRSKAVSLANGDELHNIPDTFYDWLRSQPEESLIDMLGAATAAKVMAANSALQDISVTDAVIPLTVEQFRRKINLIVM